MSEQTSDATVRSSDQVPVRFDGKLARPFIEKSLSAETRRAYARVIREFFRFVNDLHPSQVTPEHVLRWRDTLRTKKSKSATVSFKLSVVRSFFAYLQAGGVVPLNPAATRLVPPPEVPSESAGRALTAKEVRYLLAGQERSTAAGARDYALLLVMLRLGVRVSEACSLKRSSIKWSHGRWVVKFKVKGGRERTLPLPSEVKKAIDEYTHLDANRRTTLHSGGGTDSDVDEWIFQPHTNYRTLEFDKPLSVRMACEIVKRWASYSGIGHLSPHDLRRTAITKALDQGLSYRQVQMMSGHKDPKTVMRYDHGRDNLDQNAVNYLDYNTDH